MVAFKFPHVCLESFALNLPEVEVTSAELEDRVAPLYQRLGIPFGTLEKLSGVKTRRLWTREVMPSQGASKAGEEALQQISFSRDKIGALFSCSVTRDYFEPATASLVHRNLGLTENSVSMDISNACLGFSNGLVTLATMIESGAIEAGLVVSGENIAPILEACIKAVIQDVTIGREKLLQILPTFTLGSGAAAFVLCHEKLSSAGHRLVGSVSRSASDLNDLCVGDADYAFASGDINPVMLTDSQKIISSASKLGGRAWLDFSSAFGWSKDTVDHIFCHQVGKQVNNAFYREMGLDYEKEFTVYQRFGNLVSAALPAGFITGTKEKSIKNGDKILFTGFGSGLNSIFTGIEW